MPATPTRIVITDCDHDSTAIEQAVADAIVVQYVPITDRVLAALPQLKAIGRWLAR